MNGVTSPGAVCAAPVLNQRPGPGSTASLAFMLYLMAVTLSMIAPLLPEIVSRLSLVPANAERHLSFLTAVYSIGVVTAAPLFGSASDRIGRRQVMFAAAVLYAGTLYGIVAQPGLEWLYLLRLASGVCMGTFLPVAMAYVAEHGEGVCRTQRFGWLTTATMAGALTGPYVDELQFWTLAPPLDGRLAPLLAGAVLISVALPVLVATLGEPAPRARRKRCPAAFQPSPTPLYLLFGLSAIVMYSVSTFEVGLSTLARQHLGLDTRALAMMYGECALVMLVMQVGFLFRRVRNVANRHLLGPVGLVTAVMVALFPFAATHAQLMWLTAIIAGGAGMMAPLISYRISRRVYARPGKRFGQQNAAAHVGLALGAASSGWLAPFHPHLPYLLAAAVLCVASAVTWKRLRRGYHGQQHQNARPAVRRADGRPAAAFGAAYHESKGTGRRDGQAHN